MTKAGGVRGAPLVRRGPPEISMEWVDVAIDIRVCGLDLPPEERGYLSLYPRCPLMPPCTLDMLAGWTRS